jgi:DNA-binding MarR family transcriptional regulator
VPTRDVPSPDDFLGYTVVRLAHLLERRMDAGLAPLGLNARQFSVLVWLARTPEINGQRLAQLVLITPQSMSDLLASMVRAGWVKRAAVPAKGRALPVSLTRSGRDLLGRAFAVVQEQEASLRSVLKAGEAKETNERLLKMLANLSSAHDVNRHVG